MTHSKTDFCLNCVPPSCQNTYSALCCSRFCYQWPFPVLFLHRIPRNILRLHSKWNGTVYSSFCLLFCSALGLCMGFRFSVQNQVNPTRRLLFSWSCAISALDCSQTQCSIDCANVWIFCGPGKSISWVTFLNLLTLALLDIGDHTLTQHIHV